MLELNKWFFVQLANFLLLLIVLNIILFRPLLKLFQQRDEGIRGALEQAKDLDREKDTVLAEIDEKLAVGRGKAKTAYGELSSEGLSEQKRLLGHAQNEAVEINRKARKDIETSVEKARVSLKKDVDYFSRQIVDKLVGSARR